MYQGFQMTAECLCTKPFTPSVHINYENTLSQYTKKRN